MGSTHYIVSKMDAKEESSASAEYKAVMSNGGSGEAKSEAKKQQAKETRDFEFSSAIAGTLGTSESVISLAVAYFEEAHLRWEDSNLMELFDFECRHWHLFDPDMEEHSLEHTRLHGLYCNLFEEKIECFVQRHGIDVQGFYQLVQAEISGEARAAPKSPDAPAAAARKGERPSSERLLQVIHQATDFAVWSAGMKQAVRNIREESSMTAELD